MTTSESSTGEWQPSDDEISAFVSSDPYSSAAFRAWAAEGRMPEPRRRWAGVIVSLVIIGGCLGVPGAALVFSVGRIVGAW